MNYYIESIQNEIANIMNWIINKRHVPLSEELTNVGGEIGNNKNYLISLFKR